MATGSTEQRAGEVVLRHVTEQVHQITENDRLVRLGAPQSVHDMRVATRRLRSALTTFRPVFVDDVVRPLGAELAWLSDHLGAARDAEVLRERLLGAINAEATGRPDVAAVLRQVDGQTADACRSARDQMMTALDSDRYRHLLTSLDELTTAPALAPRMARPAGQVLTRRTARAYRRLKDLVAVAGGTVEPDRAQALHDVRKAAKRARYAGEALADAYGPAAARFAAAMKDLQTDLGEHQDSVTVRAHLEELAGRTTSPAAAYLYGRVHALEQIRGDRAVERFEDSWRAASKKSLRHWLR